MWTRNTSEKLPDIFYKININIYGAKNVSEMYVK